MHLVGQIQHNSVTSTFQSCEGVEATLLVTGKEAVTVQEIRPSHVDGFKGVITVFPQGFTGATAGFDHLIILAGRGQDRAAYQTNLRGAFPVQQAVDDTEEEILRP